MFSHGRVSAVRMSLIMDILELRVYQTKLELDQTGSCTFKVDAHELLKVRCSTLRDMRFVLVMSVEQLRLRGMSSRSAQKE